MIFHNLTSNRTSVLLKLRWGARRLAGWQDIRNSWAGPLPYDIVWGGAAFCHGTFSPIPDDRSSSNSTSNNGKRATIFVWEFLTRIFIASNQRLRRHAEARCLMTPPGAALHRKQRQAAAGETTGGGASFSSFSNASHAP